MDEGRAPAQLKGGAGGDLTGVDRW